MNNSGNKSKASVLRQNAEELLKKKPFKTCSQPSEADMLKLIHELEVHQIELELQNEELILANTAAQDIAYKYTKLYDFAPSGYFTLSKDGKIIELNLNGSQMLGKERSHLINSQFGFFVSYDTRPIFNLFLENVFNSNTKESCEVVLLNNGDLPMYVLIAGINIVNVEQCFVTVVDITVNKLAEALKKKTYELEQFNNAMVGREMKMIELKREINQLLKKAGENAKYVIHE